MVSSVNREQDVARHYASGYLMARIDAALTRAGVDPANPNATDLAPVDEFHIGGGSATEAFANKLPFKRGDRLLDVGCGLGGPARYFANRFGAHVTGIDLTPEYIEVAIELSRRTGQAKLTTFEVGSALTMRYGDGHFDGAITVHVAMNIRDREGLYSEVARVLKPGATFGIYDVMKGNAEPIDYPVPWAMTEATSHLCTPSETQALLRRGGFEILEVEDRTSHAQAFFHGAIEAAKAAGGPAAVGLHLLTGETTAQKFANMLKAVGDGRLAPSMIVARKS
jgi:ubiquinone/menaquinone biosynthesis C-methylase UbiE